MQGGQVLWGRSSAPKEGRKCRGYDGIGFSTCAAPLDRLSPHILDRVMMEESEADEGEEQSQKSYSESSKEQDEDES